MTTRARDREREPRPEDLQYASYWDRRYEIDQADAAAAAAATTNITTAPPSTDSASAISQPASTDPPAAPLPDYDWFRTFSAIRPFLTTYLPSPSATGPSILHLGCGNSTLPSDLHALSYHSQTAVDFSRICISAMASKYAHLSPQIAWDYADVRDMNAFSAGTLDVAIDKGTLDAMLHGSMWDPPQDVRDSVSRYVREVWRVLREGGVWLYVTYRQPHFMRPLLTVEGAEWEGGPKVEVLNEGGGEFEYFGWVMRKRGSGSEV